MYKVICFARVSTTAQDLQPQIEAVKKAILYDGYMESEILYVQGKESAIKLKEEERQTLNEMKLLVTENPTIESVYFFAVDRLARRMSIVMSVKEWADERKLNLVFLSPHAMHTFRKNEKGEWVEDELTTLLLAMLSYGASMEMKVKKARFETAKEAMRLQGKLVQGNPLKGYCLDKDRNILIDEVEAELVRNLFNDYLHGEYTLTTLHDKYAKKGLFEPNINRSTIKVRIHNILNNTAYSGNPRTSNYCKKHGLEHKIHYPPIISKELHQQVLDKLHSRKTEKKINTKHICYAKGIIRCKLCNHIMRPQIGVCNYSCFETGEHSISVNLNVVDSVVWYNAAEWYKYYMAVDFDTTKSGYINKMEETKQSIIYIEGLISKELDKQDKAFKKYYQGKLREVVYDAIVEESKNEVKKLNNELSKNKLLVTEYNRLIENVNNTKILHPSELFMLDDVEKVSIINKVVKALHVERLDKFKYKFTLTPTDMLQPFVLDTEYYIFYASPNANKLEVYYLICDEWKCRDITDIIIKRHQRKKYGKH